MAKKKKKFNIRTEWKNNKDNIRWLFKQGKGFRRSVFGFLAISMVSMVVSLSSSIAGKYVVDAATGFGEGSFWQYIILMLSTTLVTIILSFSFM